MTPKLSLSLPKTAYRRAAIVSYLLNTGWSRTRGNFFRRGSASLSIRERSIRLQLPEQAPFSAHYKYINLSNDGLAIKQPKRTGVRL
jgi:hypothetical protein